MTKETCIGPAVEDPTVLRVHPSTPTERVFQGSHCRPSPGSEVVRKALHWVPAIPRIFSPGSASSTYQPKCLRLHLLPGSSSCHSSYTHCLGSFLSPSACKGIDNTPSPNGVLSSKESSVS